MPASATIRRRTHVLAGILLWGGVPLVAQEVPADSEAQSLREAIPKLMGLFEKVRQLGDWQQQEALITNAIEAFYHRQGWSTEVDQFAKQTAVEVARIPPWRIQQRLDTITRRLQERYGLADDQRERLKQRMFRETLTIVARNIGTISRHTDDILRARQARTPFTAEQVAGWMQESCSLRADWQRSIDALVNDIQDMVPETARERFEQDRDHFYRRMEDVRRLQASWERGEWTPQHWGLDDDPSHAQSSGNDASGHKPDSPASGVLSSVTDAGYRSLWAQYVRDFIREYDLDRSQQVTAWSILEELEDRARRIKHVNTEDDSASRQPEGRTPSTQSDRSQDPDPADVIFQELKNRLDQLVTNAQRGRAAASSRPSPSSE